jgi:O-antigen ligase
VRSWLLVLSAFAGAAFWVAVIVKAPALVQVLLFLLWMPFVITAVQGTLARWRSDGDSAGNP